MVNVWNQYQVHLKVWCPQHFNSDRIFAEIIVAKTWTYFLWSSGDFAKISKNQCLIYQGTLWYIWNPRDIPYGLLNTFQGGCALLQNNPEYFEPIRRENTTLPPTTKNHHHEFQSSRGARVLWNAGKIRKSHFQSKVEREKAELLQ